MSEEVKLAIYEVSYFPEGFSAAYDGSKKQSSIET
jgi:hypothetical protein